MLICYLCDRKRSKQLAFHRIPKEENTRRAWLKFLDLDEKIDNVSTLHICSGHFTANDYLEPNAVELGARLRLKRGSVPSIRIPTEFTKTSKLSQHTKNKIYTPAVDPLSISTQCTFETTSSDLPSLTRPKIIICTPEMLSKTALNTSEKINCTSNPLPAPVSQPPAKIILYAPELLPKPTVPSIENANSIKPELTEISSQSPEKFCKFDEPRFISEINSSHLSTPRGVQMCITIAKRKVLQQAKEIKNQQQRNRRLLKQNNKLKDMVNHLKKKNLQSEKVVKSMAAVLSRMLKS